MPYEIRGDRKGGDGLAHEGQAQRAYGGEKQREYGFFHFLTRNKGAWMSVATEDTESSQAGARAVFAGAQLKPGPCID